MLNWLNKQQRIDVVGEVNALTEELKLKNERELERKLTEDRHKSIKDNFSYDKINNIYIIPSNFIKEYEEDTMIGSIVDIKFNQYINIEDYRFESEMLSVESTLNQNNHFFTYNVELYTRKELIQDINNNRYIILLQRNGYYISYSGSRTKFKVNYNLTFDKFNYTFYYYHLSLNDTNNIVRILSNECVEKLKLRNGK